MKKHWKKITLVLAVVLLSVAGYLVYVLQFKEYETADENVEKVTKEKIEIDLPDDTKLVVDEDGNVVEAKDGETGEVAGEGTDAEGSAGTEAAKGDSSSADGKSEPGSAVTTTSAKESSGSANGGSSSAGDSGSNGSTSGGGSNDKAAAGNASSGNGSAGKAGSGNGGSNGSNGSSGSNGESGRVTVSQIKSKYQPTLSGLEADANAKIGGLINVAKNEYAQDSKDGSVSYPYYYNKYMGAATDLEKRMDSAFYAVVDVMKKDLKANGLAESHTKAVIDEYEATKKQRRSELISKAAGM